MLGNNNKPYFPLFVDLSDKHIVVAGAGKIAARRINTLLNFAGKITVIAPEINEEIHDASNLYIKKRLFNKSDIDDADYVIAATNNEELNREIAVLCKEKGIPVNASHDKSLCDFFFPGVIQDENVVIGVTASGTDHKKAKEVTNKIKETLMNLK